MLIFLSTIWGEVHTYGGDGVKICLDAGVDSIEHSAALDDELIDQMVCQNTWLVPTFTVLRKIAALGELDPCPVPEYMPRKAQTLIEVQTGSFQKALAAGVRIAMGTDLGSFGRGDNAQELAYMVEAGMTPMQAIVACERLFERKLGLPRRDDVEQTLHLPKLFLPIRIFGDPDSALALTPVDFAAQTIARLLEDSSPGETFHIVPERVPRNREVAAAVRLALNVAGIEFAPHRRHFPLDMVYNRLIKDLLPYLSHQPRFTTSVGADCPPINASYLERILRYWRNDGNEFHQRDQRAGNQDAVRRDPEGADRAGAYAHQPAL